MAGRKAVTTNLDPLVSEAQESAPPESQFVCQRGKSSTRPQINVLLHVVQGAEALTVPSPAQSLKGRCRWSIGGSSCSNIVKYLRACGRAMPNAPFRSLT